MPRSASTEDQAAQRRSVVPDAAGRSLWRAAVWTGLGAAIACATLAIVVVAACWLPVSGTTGRTNSSIRAGLLTFLASLHGGITVDGVSAAWLPLGMVLIVAATAWRAGAGLADAADVLDDRDPVRLALAGLAQAAAFTLGCLVAVPFATLGTSRAPFLGVGAAGFLLFLLTGGTAFVRSSPLRAWCAERLPGWLAPMARAGGAAVAAYLSAGALLVAGSLVVHHTEVEQLSRQVGGGWGSVPILVLGLLAAPNAAIAGSAYLAGPGFAVGSGTSVSIFGSAHGTLPAFPLLGAVPVQHGTNAVVWSVVAVTPLVAGLKVARIAARTEAWARRCGIAAGGAVVAGLAMLVLGWQGGGSAGDARLLTVGASPWQLGGAVAGAVAVVAGTALGVAALWRLLIPRVEDGADFEPLFPVRPSPLRVVATGRPERAATDTAIDGDGQGELAG